MVFSPVIASTGPPEIFSELVIVPVIVEKNVKPGFGLFAGVVTAVIVVKIIFVISIPVVEEESITKGGIAR
tara:strand:+ start:164 stop:376 length:213 start_codon:yes stop_codon:yes gene_type:complete